MAGAGYKLFTTGSVLTAAEVNTYLQEQAVMRFATVAARTAALSGVLAEGMVSYIDATDTLEVYNGSAWISAIGDITEVQGSTGISVASGTGPVPVITNSMATAIDAKGDLIVGTGDNAFSRLAVSDNGSTLVADSSTSTGLRWQGNFAAGKNKIINGDFNIWQRGTSLTPSSGAEVFLADRFSTSWSGTGTTTISRQSFTAGAAPVSGYESQYFLRMAMGTGATYFLATQKIEDVRTFAGQTVTLSFWAKSSASVTLRPILRQDFGSGGSASVDANLSDITLTTSWTRYTWTASLASISGKTIGSNSSLIVYFGNYQSGTAASNNIDFWGVQLEAGNTATAFQTATGTLAGELAACQRYYIKSFVQGTAPTTNVGTRDGAVESLSVRAAGALGILYIRFPVVMRGTPTVTVYNPLAANNQIRNLDRSSDCTGTTVEAAVDNSFRVYGTLPSGTVSTDGLSIHYQAVAEL